MLVGDLNEDRGGLLGLIDRIKAGAAVPTDSSGVSPEMQAQGVKGDMPPLALQRTDKNPYYPGQFGDVVGGSSTKSSEDTFDAKPLQEWPDEKQTDINAGITPGTPEVVTPEAKTAAAPASFARGGSPGAQPGGPTGNSDSVDAPVDMSDHPVTKALTAQGVRPEVAAMLADAARRRGELANAQKETDWRQNIAIGGNGIYTALGLNDAGEMAGRQKWANAPVENVKAQQAASDEAVGHAKGVQEIQDHGDVRDPHSAISMATAEAMGMKPGSMPAILAPEAEKRARLVLDKQRARDENTRNDKTIAGENERASEQRRTQIEVANIHANAQRRGEQRSAEVAPGFVRGNIDIDKGEEDKFREAWKVNTGMSQQLDELDASVKQSGTQMTGKVSSRQEQLAQSLQLGIKRLYVLGQISADDAARMASMAPDPTTLKAKFRNNEALRENYKAFKKELGRATSLHAKSLGLVDVRGGQEQGPAAGGGGRVKGTVNGQTKWVDPENVEKAKTMGWTPDGR